VVEVSKNYGSLPTIECSPARINQVILNLLSNAADAMKGLDHQGEILISTTADDQEVRIRIQDNASGIPEDKLAKIFDPFFTTKPAGEGTGLGLAISARIVEQHQGRLAVESELGKGTVFTLHLPIERQEEKEAPAEGEVPRMI
jgi:signal transduction histidine kinase